MYTSVHQYTCIQGFTHLCKEKIQKFCFIPKQKTNSCMIFLCCLLYFVLKQPYEIIAFVLIPLCCTCQCHFIKMFTLFNCFIFTWHIGCTYQGHFTAGSCIQIYCQTIFYILLIVLFLVQFRIVQGSFIFSYQYIQISFTNCGKNNLTKVKLTFLRDTYRQFLWKFNNFFKQSDSISYSLIWHCPG